MKIYRVWTDSNHKIQYTLGYFLKEETAKKVYRGIVQTASGPQAGIETIDVYED